MAIAPIRVLIVDDQLRARQSLKALLATCPQFASVGEAADGIEALDRIKEIHPDVVLMDARMPVMDGVETTRLIKSRWRNTKVIVLSMYGNDYAAEAMAAGADAFVSKGAPPAELLSLLSEVTRGRNLPPPQSKARPSPA